MKNKVDKILPLFLPYNDFCSRLKGKYVETAFSQSESRMYLQALQTLDGASSNSFSQVRADLYISARISRSRVYDGGKTVVYYGFRRMVGVDKYGKPLELIAVFDRRYNIECYTVCHSEDKIEKRKSDPIIEIYDEHYNQLRFEKASLKRKCIKAGKFKYVRIKRNAREGAFLKAVGRNSVKGKMFHVNWDVAGEPWCVEAKNVALDKLVAMFDALVKNGLNGLSGSLPWKSHDSDRGDASIGFDVDLELCRFLGRAKKDGNAIWEKTIRATGIAEENFQKSRVVYVAAGARSQMIDELRAYANVSAENGDTVLMLRCLAYLALSGDVFSMHDLGWSFHFGKGIRRDYDLSVYWHEQAARKGDVFAMQNLGVIYSEKASPVRDCKKAFYWFEKAIANGDERAMGQLAHCLLCGKNGKDVNRELKLLRSARKAFPKDAELREMLERAKRMKLRGE